MASAESLSVLHVSLSLDYGGLERVVLHLVKQAARLQQRVNLLCLERRGALAERAEALGATVYCINKKPGLKWKTIGEIQSVLDVVQPAIVHTHQIGALFYTGPAARNRRVPVVVHTEHGKQIRTVKQKVLAWWATRYAQRFYSVSADIQQALAGRLVPLRKMEVIANGIDVDHLQQPVDTASLRQAWNIPSDAVVIGTIGRLAWVKRQELLLQVFALVQAQIPQCYLMLVGDGEERQKLEAEAERLGVAERVRFTGFQSEPGQFLHLMSAFLLTSESEGMPLSLLEAWAVGVPVLTFAVGGLPELIVPGETGYLAPFGDTQALAGHVVQLLRDPLAAKAMIQRCQEKVVRDFDVARMAEAYDSRYRALLKGRAG